MAVNKFIECSVRDSIVRPDNLATLRLYAYEQNMRLKPFCLKT